MNNKQKYRLFCKTEKDIPIFSKDWWLDSVCGEDNWNVALVEKEGEIFASLPYYVKRKYGFRLITMPILTQTMGPYIKYPEGQKYEKRISYDKKIMDVLFADLSGVDLFSQNFHYSVSNWLPLYWEGYDQTTRYTYVIENLNDLDAVFNNIKSSYKNKIRKAKKNITISHGMSIEEFYKINMMTFERQNIMIPYSLGFMIEHDKCIKKNNSGEIFFAFDEKQEIHSVLYLTWDNKSSYVHLVGENPQLRNSGAGILLIWEAIKYTSKVLKLNKFDFEGSMLKNVEPVRRSFGATQKSYFIITKTNSRLLRIRNALKELLS
jgi:hypothetical protein